jgi:hypothetical protein
VRGGDVKFNSEERPSVDEVAAAIRVLRWAELTVADDYVGTDDVREVRRLLEDLPGQP